MAKRTGEKYQAIIEAAVKVIAENGYHNSQVSKIAKEAGVADGTIYLYFKNKEDVLISLFRSKMGEFTASARQELKKLHNPFEKLAKLIALHFDRLESDRNLALVLQIQLRQSDASIRSGIAGPLKEYLNIIEDIVEQGIICDYFRDDVDPKLARQMIFGTMDEVATSWVMSHREYSLTNLIRPAYYLLARALAKGDTIHPY
ncbi:transcriptional regulator, TetR family [Desulfotomaculum arcticum]|uniref:Transcriptional regulator, TetR family n=1 Tax=Desulfotruncus arcticus DSM 17038 TaxID=1121424 RepID=A0A1I2WLJ0_9FIRM|nr:TetR/AcrR family transcriptional regulator [Desulfotruncus arcticus]SFH02198.1 transcriptional regulator, TetR family [Desulfotomaculum arcticum] [Desulfotruncus arcticus DSM 17038]